MTASTQTRVLMVLENNPYPFDQRVRAQAETLVAAGYGVTVVCPGEKGQPAYEVVRDVAVYRFPAPPQGRGVVGYMLEFGVGTLLMAVYTLYLLLTQRFHVVHVFNPPDTIFVCGILARLLGKRVVMDHRDLAPELYQSKFGDKRPWLHRTLLLLERLAARQADLLLATNESYRKLQIERDGVAPERIVIVRNGPRAEEMVASEPDAELRARASIVLGYMGHMSSQDGIDYLLQSLQHLRYTLGVEDFFCVLIGPADDLDSLKALARKLRVDDKVQFTGRLPFGARLLSYLRAADICLEPAPSNPLNDKSTMTKIMEYMALGKPLVVYDLPENRVSAGRAALYTTPNDALEYARNIHRLIESPELRQQLGAYGSARISEQLGWAYSARRLVDGYERMLTRSSGAQTVK